MKNLYKTITLFVIILIAGVFITVITINKSLNTITSPEKTVEVQKDTVYLLNAEKKTV